MAMLGGGPRKRLSKRAIRDLKMRVRLTGRAREAGLKEAGGLSRAFVRAGGSLLRRFGRNIPGVGRFVPGSAQRIARAERLAGIQTMAGGAPRQVGKFFRPSPVRPSGLVRAPAVLKTGGRLVVAGAALELGARGLTTLLPGAGSTKAPELTSLDFFRPGGKPMAHPAIGGGPSRGGELVLGSAAPAGNTIVKVWDTGTAQFARDASGMHYVLKKDGTIKRFRPPRPVVVPKNWNPRAMNRVMRRLGSHQKAAIKLVTMLGGSASKTRSSRRQHSLTHP